MPGISKGTWRALADLARNIINLQALAKGSPGTWVRGSVGLGDPRRPKRAQQLTCCCWRPCAAEAEDRSLGARRSSGHLSGHRRLQARTEWKEQRARLEPGTELVPARPASAQRRKL